jgi:hypothetical protein
MTRVPFEPNGPQEEPQKPPEFRIRFLPPPFETDDALRREYTLPRRRVRTRLWEEDPDD